VPTLNGRRPKTVHATQNPLLTDLDVAKILNVSIGSVRRWRLRRRGGPPYLKLGFLVRYEAASVANYLAESNIKTAAMIPLPRCKAT
jgi:hypothetical protein